MGLIELKNITFRYKGEEETVLSDFDMNVDTGEFVVVEGDNGSGKTTLFRILNGLSFPENGEYIFDGIKITKDYLKNNSNSKHFHKRIGYLFQNPDIMLFNARVYDEVAFGPRQMGLSDPEVDKRVRDCMELFEISGLSDKAPYHLSEGQKKRVALASVMVLNPDVLILDEPFAGLDKKTQSRLISFLEELMTAGKTIIVASHSEERFSELATQNIKLS